MLILGGSGSLAGAVVGAIAVNVSLEVLRNPDHARWLFYSVILLTLLAKLRPWRKFGCRARLHSSPSAMRSVRDLVARSGPPVPKARRPGATPSAVAFRAGSSILPSTRHEIGNFGFVLLIALVLLLTVIKDPWRTVLLVPTIYLAAFVWENLLMASFEAQAATRFILLGALLVVLMAARPQGLVGRPESRSRDVSERAVLELREGEQVVRRAARAR